MTVVGRASPNPNRLNMDRGMRLILAPKSHKALSKISFSMVQLRGANDASRVRVQLSSTRTRKLESELELSSKARELEK